jgi:hypothetical protein
MESRDSPLGIFYAIELKPPKILSFHRDFGLNQAGYKFSDFLDGGLR